jgi:hypothetical protein
MRKGYKKYKILFGVINLETSVERVARASKTPNLKRFSPKFGESSSHHYGESNFGENRFKFKY